MLSLETTMLGMALAIDAAVVSFAVGLLHTGLNRSQKIIRVGYLCLVFGLFQFAMVWLGSYAGYLFSFSQYGHLFHVVISASFVIIGASALSKSFDREEKQVTWGIFPILIMGLITSLDALASGLSLGTLPLTHLMALEIGLITALMCALAYGLSTFIKTFSTAWPLRLAALVFFFLGGRIIYAYLG